MRRMVTKKVLLSEFINNKVMEHSQRYSLTTSAAIRNILSEYFNNKKQDEQDKKMDAMKKMKQNLIELLNRSHSDISKDLIKIKNALLVIGKSSAVSSKQVREIFANDNFVN